MKKIIKIITAHSFEILISLLTILFVFSPYIRPDLIIGSDYPFHLARIETLAQNLKYGIFPTKVHVDLCYGYGYGVGFFYPNFFLYIPALFCILGFSLEVSFKLFAGILLTAIFLSIFYCTYRLTHDRYVSLSSAVIFLFTNQVLGSFYYEFTLGTSLGLIFMPLAICGMYLFLVEDQKPYLLGLGFTGLIYSHVLSTTLSLIVCIIIMFVHINKLLRTPGKIKSLLFTVLGVSGLTASFWLPMFEQFIAQKYRVSQPWTYVDDNVLYLSKLINSDGLGWVLTLIVIGIGMWVIIEHNKNNKFLFFYITGIVFMLLPLCGHFWRLFRNVFKFLQFPKRLMGPACIMIIFAFSIWLSTQKLTERYQKYITVILLMFSLYAGFHYIEQRLNAVEDFGNRTLYEEIAGIGSGEEWLPLETTRDNITTPNQAISNNGTIITGDRTKQYFQFHTESGAKFYDVPFVWYKGYSAITSDGQSLIVIKNPDTGITRVQTENLPENTAITVWYHGTLLQNLSYIASVVTLLSLLGGSISMMVKRYRIYPNTEHL